MTRAAEKLHLAQPALSQAIAHLEAEVGFKLFERGPRGVTLTAPGEVFLEKARAALEAEDDADQTGRALLRADQGMLRLGYMGLPPADTSPDLIEAFVEANPSVEISEQELAFPRLPTVSWLGEVDAAICTRPADDPKVSFQPLSARPRVLLAPKHHRLAERRELAVAEVLDETFIGFAPSVDPVWAGLWSLDDHRGAPAPHVTSTSATNVRERFAMIAEGRGVAVAPAPHAAVVAKALRGVVAIPLTDADPAILTLVSRNDRQNQLVKSLFAAARGIAEDARNTSAATRA